MIPDMVLVSAFLNKRSPPGSEFWVIDSAVLSFELEVHINSKEQRVHVSTAILPHDGILRIWMKRTIMAPPIPNLRADYDQGEGMRGIQPPSLQVQSHSHP